MKAYRASRHHCCTAFVAFIRFLCLLSRGPAEFVIRVQASYARCIADVRMSAGFRYLFIVGMLSTAFGLGWLGAHTIWLREPKRDNSTGEASIDAM
jgi:hypothetical protein